MGVVGLMAVKGTEQQIIFLELGAMSLETLPEFNDIYDGTFPNSLHEEICIRCRESSEIFRVNWNEKNYGLEFCLESIKHTFRAKNCCHTKQNLNSLLEIHTEMGKKLFFL
ncbi:hypothetical protein TNCV_5024731 [Trichonephila clavipes]|nr:hypothetical protein TNCV_5024731 [Trichonephila clavipes]